VGGLAAHERDVGQADLVDASDVRAHVGAGLHARRGGGSDGPVAPRWGPRGNTVQNKITELLDIEFPIFAFSHCRDVVAAVSKAGGLGVLGAVAHTPEQLEIDLKWIEQEVGDKPYGVDLIVPAKYAGDDKGGYTLDDIRRLIPAEHQEFVEDILKRYEVPELPPDEDPSKGRGVGRALGGAAPFSAASAGPQLDIALAHRTAFVANALGPPPPLPIERVQEEGRLVRAPAGP